MTPETLRKIEDFINTQQKFSIAMDNPELIKGMSLEAFINSFHTGKIAKYDNFYQDGTKVGKGGGRRSLVDTIIACQVTLGATTEQVLEVFRKAYREKRLKGWFCTDIKRFVFRIDWEGWQLCDQNGHSMNVHSGRMDKELDVSFNDIFEDA